MKSVGAVVVKEMCFLTCYAANQSKKLPVHIDYRAADVDHTYCFKGVEVFRLECSFQPVSVPY